MDHHQKQDLQELRLYLLLSSKTSLSCSHIDYAFKMFTSRFPTWLAGNTQEIWHILGRSRQAYGSNHHPRGARQQHAHVSGVLLCFFVFGSFFCLFVCFSKSIADTPGLDIPRKPGPCIASQAGWERHPLAFLQLHYRHILTGSKPGL